ncbi:hypothetical protein GQ55_1G343700 [Panicum hallii var. hallii]|uniref:Uncharacterized protein n=1 Tax=Panicum hallii var. hallii TaxID=1504633 RepID=A0A2T7FAL5_9POAL|nr:hypothetical protein GQ55_1G343700 [Panicum hallii var. hallii]
MKRSKHWHLQASNATPSLGGSVKAVQAVIPAAATAGSCGEKKGDEDEERLSVFQQQRSGAAAVGFGASRAGRAAGRGGEIRGGEVVAALRAVEREMEAAARAVPAGVVTGVVAAVREPATARLAAKVLLVVLLDEGNRDLRSPPVAVPAPAARRGSPHPPSVAASSAHPLMRRPRPTRRPLPPSAIRCCVLARAIALRRRLDRGCGGGRRGVGGRGGGGSVRAGGGHGGGRVGRAGAQRARRCRGRAARAGDRLRGGRGGGNDGLHGVNGTG